MNKIKIVDINVSALNLKACLKKYVNKHLHLKYKELWKNNLFNDNQKSNCSNKLKNNFTFEPYSYW